MGDEIVGKMSNNIATPNQGGEKMKYQNIVNLVKEPILRSKREFFGVGITLISETLIALLMPQILSKIIDNLEIKPIRWLYIVTVFFCSTVLLKGTMSILNTYLSEKLGWRICDYLKVDILKKTYSLTIEQHKKIKTGEFIERIEGDVNILVHFFSSMLIDIVSSTLLVVGILFVFYQKSLILGIIFTILSMGIMLLFIKTQDSISLLWKKAREKETEVLGEYTQTIEAQKDIVGVGKEEYVLKRFDSKYKRYKKHQIKASFIGNIPATIFFSLLNVGEGVVLAIGVYLMERKQLTMGNLYLILSYVGTLNIPFYNLKYEFAQLPIVTAALERINSIYCIKSEEREDGIQNEIVDGSIVFDNVYFGYETNNMVLNGASFSIDSGEKILIEGRTGSGKSTILQLIAGLYEQNSGNIMVGGHAIKDYQKDAYNRAIYYIFQFNPIVNDTVKNNVTRFVDKYDEETVINAIKSVKLDRWMNRGDKTLHTIISSEDVTEEEAQLIAWAGVLLAKPKILLVDEFDASINDETIKIIDEIVNQYLNDVTIIFVSHKGRSTSKIQKRIHLNGDTVKWGE